MATKQVATSKGGTETETRRVQDSLEAEEVTRDKLWRIEAAGRDRFQRGLMWINDGRGAAMKRFCFTLRVRRDRFISRVRRHQRQITI